ncbi:MAG: GTP-binding protein, partial [Sneathiellales bacterium]|nr:GTP-binding protein [Sneathiellales bacterium]
AASILFVNKQDMLNGGQREELGAILKELNPSALQMETINAAVSPDLIFADFWRENIPEIEEHHHLHGDMFESWSHRSDLGFSGDNLKKMLSATNEDLFRFKGIFNNTDDEEKSWSIHKVGALIDLHPLKNMKPSDSAGSFVAIGLKGTAFEKELDQFFN